MKILQVLLVLDTNTLVRGILNSKSPAGVVLDGCLDRVFPLLLSKPVIAEYRAVLSYDELLARNPGIQPKRITATLARLRYVGEFRYDQSKFSFPRDPDDAKFLELAIAGNATHIITHDLDLLSLGSAHTPAAKQLRQRLPGVTILTAHGFLAEIAKNTNGRS